VVVINYFRNATWVPVKILNGYPDIILKIIDIPSWDHITG